MFARARGDDEHTPRRYNSNFEQLIGLANIWVRYLLWPCEKWSLLIFDADDPFRVVKANKDELPFNWDISCTDSNKIWNRDGPQSFSVAVRTGRYLYRLPCAHVHLGNGASW